MSTSTAPTQRTPMGVIEGFFGVPWSWHARRDYADFLHDYGFEFYIYAPKSDDRLRQRWREPWSKADWAQLQALRAHYAQRGVQFGIGLTPYELQRSYDRDAARALAAKISLINSLQPDLLAILFDDIPNIDEGAASLQVRIVSDALSHSDASTHLVCPSFYSDDPLLEKALGKAPPDYLEQLGAQLPGHVHIMWTGPKVCSKAYPLEHLQDITHRLGRAPFIWDNYPVNDGPRMCKHLHLRPFTGREALPGNCAGIAANPMNQAELSKIPLGTLSRLAHAPERYEPTTVFEEIAETLFGAAVARALAADLTRLHDDGLEHLDAAQVTELRRKYAQLNAAVSEEICAWLDGFYEPSAELMAEFESFAQQQSSE